MSTYREDCLRAIAFATNHAGRRVRGCLPDHDLRGVVVGHRGNGWLIICLDAGLGGWSAGGMTPADVLLAPLVSGGRYAYLPLQYAELAEDPR
jgi:hypothetical protein